PEDAKGIDLMVTELDAVLAEEAGEPLEKPASTGYAVVTERWERYHAHVQQLDDAVAEPFADGASAMLMTAVALVDRAAHDLAFMLAHVGEAIHRRRQVKR